VTRSNVLSLLLRSSVVLFVISTVLPLGHGQTLASSAALSGAVADQSGAHVANATVKLSNPEKGISRVFKADAEGHFSFPLLPAGTYNLTVEAPNFKTYRQVGITLEVGQVASQIVTLTVGSAQENVEVTAQQALLQTESANIGTEISTKQVTELPLNLRNVFNFVELNSSVNNLSQRQTISSGGEQGTADQDVSFLNFGGGYFGTTAFLLDGAWDTSTGWGGVIYVPSPDNVQEFKVQQNSFSAQYGWSTGNVVNVVTKSGTRSLHGVAFEYLRNGDLDANFYFNNLNGLPRPNSHRNQFGVGVGGPVYIPGIYKQRDKTFWYFLYEAHRENNPLATPLSNVPTSAFRAGDFSALLGTQIGTDALCRPILAGQIYDPFSTRQVTATCGPNSGKTVYIRDPVSGNNLTQASTGIDPVGQKLVNYYPKPLNNQLTENWSATGVAGNDSDEYSGRIDHNFTDKTRLYGRYSYKKQSKGESPAYFGADNPAGPGQVNPNNRWSIALGLNQVFTPTFTMSVNLGGMKWVEGNQMQSAGFKPSSLGLPNFIDASSAQFPVINATPYLSEGPLQGAGEAKFPRSAVSGSVDFVKVKGSHQLSFGYMQVAIDENGGRIAPTTFTFNNVFTAGPDPNSPTTGGDAIASMMLGTPTSGSTGVNVFNVSRTWLDGMYLQDDWKLNRKLTVNLGMRWEVQRPITDRHNRLATFDYQAVNPISSVVGQNYTGRVVFATSGNRGQYDTDYKHFAPRVGFAYQIMHNLVMRGGFGVFFPNQFLNSPNIIGYTSSTPYVASTNGGISPCAGCTLSNAFPNGAVPIVGSSMGGLTNVGFSTSAVNRQRKNYYGEQWMYGFQYSPHPSDVIDITYVGNHNVHTLTSGLNLNQIDPKYFSMGDALLNQVPNPLYGHVPAGSSCNLDQPTVAAGQLLRPHPEFCDINETQDPAGNSHYNALQVNYTHRISQGLTLLASYTFSKFIDNMGGPETWANASSNFSENIRNVYNLAAEKSVDPTDTPNSFVLSYVYELPVGKGKKFGSGLHGVSNQILGGWQTTGIITSKEGFPLTITSSGNGLNYFGAGQHVDVVGKYRVSHQSRTQWFNNTPPGLPGAAFQPAAPWTLGDAPRFFSDLRAPNYNNWDLGVQKHFPIKESTRLEFRLDMFNAFNRTNFYSPNTYLPSAGATSPGTFGTITETWTPRLLQAVLRLNW
jgi:hypothetical protein